MAHLIDLIFQLCYHMGSAPDLLTIPSQEGIRSLSYDLAIYLSIINQLCYHMGSAPDPLLRGDPLPKSCDISKPI